MLAPQRGLKIFLSVCRCNRRKERIKKDSLETAGLFFVHFLEVDLPQENINFSKVSLRSPKEDVIKNSAFKKVAEVLTRGFYGNGFTG